MITSNRRLISIMLTASFLLLIPLVANQFTDGEGWNWFDFMVAGILLFGTGLLCELVLRKFRKMQYRIAFCAVILLALFIIWVELSVGIFGSPLAGS